MTLILFISLDVQTANSTAAHVPQQEDIPMSIPDEQSSYSPSATPDFTTDEELQLTDCDESTYYDDSFVHQEEHVHEADSVGKMLEDHVGLCDDKGE